jgi:hypothetical protein
MINGNNGSLYNMAQTLEATIPACRNQYGHLTKYPGRICYTQANWRLVYVGTIDGRHEFFAEHSSRINLGSVSFQAAKQAMVDIIKRETT